MGIGVICLATGIPVSASVGSYDAQLVGGPSHEVFEKPPIVVAQLLQAPPDSEDSPSAPASRPAQPDSAAPDTPETDEDASSFVFAGDLAVQLRKIDPSAKVEWDGKKLNIRTATNEFAIFPSGREMVINGDIETGTPPLKIRNGEIYVPQEVVSRIGRQLEQPSADDAPVTTTVTPAPTPTPTPEPTATPEVTPESTSILPDATPAIATPTPRATGSVLPDVTPAATPAATAAPVVATPSATPFPVATPTPTPKPTPTPTPTPVPEKTESSPAPIQPDIAASTDAFKSALRDKISVSTENLVLFTQSQLQEKTANRSIKKVVIHADDSGIAKSDEYGKRSAEIALKVAQRVQAQLSSANIEAVLTRSTDKSLPIGETMELVTQSDAQALLIVSVGYSTAFTDLGGFRVFYMNESVDYNSLRQRSFDASEAVPAELNYKPFQNGSKVLASSLKNSISGALKREPVGTNPIPQYLTRRAPMAAATVVVGYLSNPADAKRLTEDSELDAMATALTEGIRNFATQVSQGEVTDDAAEGL